MLEKKKDALDASDRLFSESDDGLDELEDEDLSTKRPRKRPSPADSGEWMFGEGMSVKCFTV